MSSTVGVDVAFKYLSILDIDSLKFLINLSEIIDLRDIIEGIQPSLKSKRLAVS